jgi:hypothetical protein
VYVCKMEPEKCICFTKEYYAALMYYLQECTKLCSDIYLLQKMGSGCNMTYTG